jgi:transaldolase
MKIFIDTAKLDEIEQAYSYGILDGVTTNPSLIKKAVDDYKAKRIKIDIRAYIKQILKTARGTPVSLEVIGTTYKEMVEEGKKLFKLFNPVAKNVYIKIPVNPALERESDKSFDGIRAIKELSNLNIPTNCTLIFTPEQALLAAKAGASFVSPFAGRVDDYIRKGNRISFDKTDYFPEHGWKKGKLLEDNGVMSGVNLVRQCIQIIAMHNLKTKVLAASIRNARQARECALAGADIATLPLDVIKDLLTHYKTIEGMNGFVKDTVKEYANLLK